MANRPVVSRITRHGGIMEAVRNIPYGIQQPAVSGQVAQLEEPVPIRHWSFELPTVLNGGDSHCIGNLFPRQVMAVLGHFELGHIRAS